MDRFLKYVAKTEDPNGCWEWIGGKIGGYGRLRVNKKLMMAHRVSYEIYNGDIPKDLVVRHMCNNTLCVNPEHLRSGTQKDNMADVKLSGRFHKLNGEENGCAKLTKEQVLEIRSSNLPGVEFAKKYNVTDSAISAIRLRKSWSHI